MAIPLQVQQDNLDASWRLLGRMFTDNEKALPNLIFGTTQPPIPSEFRNPQHPFTQRLLGVLNDTMVGFTTYVTVKGWGLDPNTVDQLQVDDPRVVSLKARVKEEIAKIPRNRPAS